MEELTIRKIQQGDNEKIALLIRSILLDMGVPKVGTAYEDKALDDMYNEYAKVRSSYFVAEKSGEILGCAGIAPLQNVEENICELQKMYVAQKARGQGVAKQLMQTCLDSAKDFEFKACYLETMPYMKAAHHLYEKFGFQFIEDRLGDTGHYSCPVFMIKYL
ncbi:GNAT family N-acetyltransferase [Flagellimonas meridianipacifica]|uniref:Putative acetyltransferase n=1 Tax=Flagellimonas meridianipacifica TaxID=1080225 RepID=A0A2T0MAE6_9FLAO|nr:GNAT family N-acetyltransferase [Allomuricauda pacifica]PRX54496.1 putative acetyltransferase [Allomuricauda pacifica]